jgi:hypothetical protein
MRDNTLTALYFMCRAVFIYESSRPEIRLVSVSYSRVQVPLRTALSLLPLTLFYAEISERYKEISYIPRNIIVIFVRIM